MCKIIDNITSHLSITINLKKRVISDKICKVIMDLIMSKIIDIFFISNKNLLSS